MFFSAWVSGDPIVFRVTRKWKKYDKTEGPPGLVGLSGCPRSGSLCFLCSTKGFGLIGKIHAFQEEFVVL